MKEVEYFIVDVFAEAKFCGNQLAVFLDDGRLSSEEMQTIAREMNFSETTFITSLTPRNGAYDTRIFTPVNEIPFAGHPTLGTALVIAEKVLQEPVDTIGLNLEMGSIPVAFVAQGGDQSILWMTQKEPVFGEEYDLVDFAAMLSIDKVRIRTTGPIQMVSTGLPTVIVGVQDLETLQQIKVQPEPYRAFIDKAGDVNLLVYCMKGYTEAQDIAVRVFADWARVPEDPATGSANGCFAAYLLQHNILNTENVDVTVGQGYELGRPSQLYLKAKAVDGRIEPRVGGKAFIVANGKMQL